MATEGVTGSPEDGYFRDPRARGLKSGRLSPRVPIRPPVRDQIRLANGLVSAGDIDMHHGMLFHPDDPAIKPVMSDAQFTAAEGVPALRPSSAPGFMPGVTGSDAGRVSAHDQKINALKAITDNSVLEDNTIRGAVKAVESTFSDDRSEWYGEMAADALIAETNKVNRGLSDPSNRINAHQLRRATAYASARSPWDAGNPAEGSYSIENITKIAGIPKHMEEGGAPEDHLIPSRNAGFTVKGETRMPHTREVLKKVGKALSPDAGAPEDTSAPHSSTADKVATFDSGLGHGLVRSVPSRRHLSDAMVIDTWQAKAAGQRNYDTAKREGGYDALAMITRRAVLRQGARDLKDGRKPMLPIDGQSNSWENIRPPERMSRMSLFMENSKGELVPNDFDKVQQWSNEMTRQVTEGRQVKIPKKKDKK